MNPNNDPNPYVLDGVHDYEATIPFFWDGDPARRPRKVGEIRVRVPATDEKTALFLADMIGTHLDKKSTGAGGAPLRTLDRYGASPITVKNVDDSPSPADLAAELDYYKRIMAALAGKYPMLLSVSAEEFAAADPTQLRLARAGDTATFVHEQMYQQMAALAGLQNDRTEPVLMPAIVHPTMSDLAKNPDLARLQVWNGAWLTILGVVDGDDPDTTTLAVKNPDGTTGNLTYPSSYDVAVRELQPRPWGRYDDLDVRRIRVRNLPAFNADTVEIAVDGYWVRVAGVNVDADGNVTVTSANDPTRPDHLRLKQFSYPKTSDGQVVLVRPATIEGYGDDLPAAPLRGRQVLFEDGWWNIDSARSTGFTNTNIEATVSRDEPDAPTRVRKLIFGREEKVLLRNQPPAGWHR
jgi:hypothetical protein